ncbi:hypothetical protein V1286_007626 [Bradyrhizobium algeriense]|uniref:S1 motif domain-containing protein n=1 Tax=Bradyrhizobium algeriense TaxID=634784 RepID=A0ABU8BNH9_9BRAD
MLFGRRRRGHRLAIGIADPALVVGPTEFDPLPQMLDPDRHVGEVVRLAIVAHDHAATEEVRVTISRLPG